MSLGECFLSKNASILTGMGKTGPTTCDGPTVELFDVNNPTIWTDILITQRNTMKLFRTEPFLGRFCLPSIVNQQSQDFYNNAVKNTAAGTKLDEYFSDLRNSYVIIIISFGFAFVVSLLYLFVLRWCAGIIVWTTILLYLAMLLALGILAQKRSKTYDERTDSAADTTTQTTSSKLMYFAIAIYCLFGLSLLLLFCYFKTIALCIAVIKSAALFVRQHNRVIFVPMIFSVFLFGYCMFGMFVLLYLWTIGTISKRSGLPLGQVTWDTNVRQFIYVHLYTMVFMTFVTLYYGQFIIVCSASLWYFNQGAEGGEPTHPSPVRTSTWWGFRYHWGSIVFAATLQSIIFTIKVIVMYAKKQAEKIQAKDPTACLIKSILNCLLCVVWCFEGVIKYVNKTGMIMVGITGNNFCSSCKSGVLLLLRHPLKFGLVAILGEFFVFLGKCFIAIITTLSGYIVITNADYYAENLYSPVIPCIFFFLVSLLVGSIFMSVYGLAADAIMVCFFVEKDLVEKQGRPICRAPQPIREFFEENKSDSGYSTDEDKKADTSKAALNQTK
jgi:Plasma-membrane choline transporter